MLFRSYAPGTLPIRINANPYASATNTLTIKPATGNVLIQGTSDSAIFVLNAADYVIIEGSASPVTNTLCPLNLSVRNLTIQNNKNDGGQNYAVVKLQSNATDGATNNIIRNCNIIGASAVAVGPVTFAGIAICAPGTISGTNLGTNNNNNTIENDSIMKCNNGIYSQGASAFIKNQGNSYKYNRLNTSGTNAIGRCGVYIGFENNSTITGNYIGKFAPLGSGQDVTGILLGGTSNSTQFSTVGSNEVTNCTITKNVIDSLAGWPGTGTSGASAIGIVGCSSPSGFVSSGTNIISNNVISQIKAFARVTSSVSDFGCGIFLGTQLGATWKVYNKIGRAHV